MIILLLFAGPILTNVELLRKDRRPRYRQLLEKYPTCYSVVAAGEHLNLGDEETCAEFFCKFPQMKAWRWEYMKLKLKMMFPEAIPLFRTLKELLRIA